MNPTVERLESLLARVQHNRKQPRAALSVAAPVMAQAAPVLAQAAPVAEPVKAAPVAEPVKAAPVAEPIVAKPAPAAPVSPKPAPVAEPVVAKPAPVAEPVVAKPAPKPELLDLPPSLDETVDDAVIVAETKLSKPAAASAAGPVLELEPHAPKDDLLDLEAPAAAAPAAAAPVAAPPVAAAPVAAAATADEEEEDEDERRTDRPVAAAIGGGPVKVAPAPLATPSGPIISVVAAAPEPRRMSYLELVQRSLSLRPR